MQKHNKKRKRKSKSANNNSNFWKNKKKNIKTVPFTIITFQHLQHYDRCSNETKMCYENNKTKKKKKKLQKSLNVFAVLHTTYDHVERRTLKR